MFYLLNKQQNIDEKCIENNFDKIEPFGENLQKKITKQLVKSLDAVKLFTSGLTKTRDLIIDISSRLQNPSLNCKKSLTRMTKCSMCINNTYTVTMYKINSIKPCYTYCLDVFKNCFVADFDQLDFIWNSHLSKYFLFFILVYSIRESLSD
jgi:hypothetical protein